jgi:hypothetical protein
MLISQLGAERRQLQEQLLERTQQHAAAAAELACLKQQLGQANAAAEQRGQQVRVGSCGCCWCGVRFGEGRGCAALLQSACQPGLMQIDIHALEGSNTSCCSACLVCRCRSS